MPEIGLEILEELDFDPEIDCEHTNHGLAPWHSGPAAHYVAAKAPCKCGRPMKAQIMLCASAWKHWGIVGVRCPGCAGTCKRDDYVRIVGSVK
jgi:hypothetical protein